METLRRPQKLQALVVDARTAVLLTAETSVRYYAGEAHGGAVLLAWEGGSALLPGFAKMRRDGFAALRSALPDSIRAVETEPDALSAWDAAQLARHLPVEVLLTQALPERVQRQRTRKEPEEIEKIRQAQAIADRAFLEMLNFVRAGMTDRELQKLIADLLWQYGSQMTSFNHVVGCGPATANPHVRPSGRVLRRGDLAMIDIGAQVDGYGSDMTRMIALGEPDERKRRIVQLVLEAQAAGIAAAKAGAVCCEVDRAARAVIERAGFGAFFPHGLGHPVGAGGPEGPRFSPEDTTPLPADIVMTVEPGIYLPGEFGVRMEDMLLITEKGSEDLTGVPRELFVV